MNLLLLSGNSKKGKEWLRQVESRLAQLFDRTYCHDYAHWENDQPEINLDHETEQLAAPAQSLAPYMIFAKSAGAILACKATAKNILRPKACLLVGFPLAMVKNHQLPVDDWLKATDFPIVVLQHRSDPLGSFHDVRQYFDAIKRKNVTIYELPGDSHDYVNFQKLKNFTESLAQET